MSNKPAEFPQLWFARVEDASLQTEEACKSLLSISEYKRFKLIKSPLKQRQYLLSRWLIRHALSNAYKQPMDFWNIEETTGSFPVVHNLPVKTYLSLSHSHDRVVVGISDTAIGVDIEKIAKRKNMAEMAELFMSSLELGLFQQHVTPALYFYETWCVKEAYFKSLPMLEQQNLSLQKIDTSHICSDKHNGKAIKFRLAEFMIAIYSEKRLSDITCFAINNTVQTDLTLLSGNHTDRLKIHFEEIIR